MFHGKHWILFNWICHPAVSPQNIPVSIDIDHYMLNSFDPGKGWFRYYFLALTSFNMRMAWPWHWSIVLHICLYGNHIAMI